MSQLRSLVLQVRPLAAHSSQDFHLWTGRAVQQLFLKHLAQQDPALAANLHDSGQLKPYTVSSLMGHFPKRQLDPNGRYTLRITSLNEPVSALLQKLTAPGADWALGQPIEIDQTQFQIAAVFTSPDQHPWADQSTYQELAASLVQSQYPRRFRFHLASPLTFKSQGLSQPLPLPELFFGSLLERWNLFSSLAFPPEAREYAQKMMAISRFDLKSRAVHVKNGGIRVGAVGSVQYTALNNDRYWLGIMHTLAAYARFAGAGAGTAHGFGQAQNNRD